MHVQPEPPLSFQETAKFKPALPSKTVALFQSSRFPRGDLSLRISLVSSPCRQSSNTTSNGSALTFDLCHILKLSLPTILRLGLLFSLLSATACLTGRRIRAGLGQGHRQHEHRPRRLHGEAASKRPGARR